MRWIGSGLLLSNGGREWNLPQIFCADDDVLLAEAEELDRRVGHADDVCRRRILKANVSKSTGGDGLSL